MKPDASRPSDWKQRLRPNASTPEQIFAAAPNLYPFTWRMWDVTMR